MQARELEYTDAEDLALEQRSEFKHEYFALYPDVSVVCGKLESAEDDRDARHEPSGRGRSVVQSRAPSTIARKKFAPYRRIPSLECYVLVSQAERLLEVFTRNADAA